MPIDIQNDTVEIALKKLKARENAFRQLERISKLGSWEVDFVADKGYWSDRSFEIYGYEPGEFEPDAQTFFRHVLPEYVEPARRLLEEMMQTQEPRSFVAKARRKDGKIIDVLLSAQVIKDQNGQVLKLIGTTQDITEYTNLKREARELLDILEKSSTEIYIIDAHKFRYLYVNKGAADKLEYTKEEMMGMDIFDINPYLSFDQAERIKQEKLSNGSAINRTIHRTKSGYEYPVQSYIHTIRYKDNDAFIIFDTDITPLVELEEKIKYQAYHDVLTALPNRLLFEDRLEQEILYAKRTKKQFALLFIDLDRFKHINDTFGHQVGDKVLLEVADRLRKTVRSCDTLARLGGDEFTILLKDLERYEDAGIVGDKIVQAIKKPIEIEGHRFYVTASVGISVYPKDTTDKVDIVKYADTAMYKAKEDGRDGVSFYKTEMTTKAYKKIELENKLRLAIENEEFEVFFQPQIDIALHSIIGVEALVRWKTPQGLVAPDKFIPLAEEIGFITQIDRIVMRKAMQIFSTWKKAGHPIGKLSLNLAMKQLLEHDFYEFIRQNIEEFDFDPAWLEFELTEGDVMQDPEKSILLLQKLHADGFDISVDDFGTGYSSLAYLKKLPLDKLKIDRSFIMDIEKDQESRDIVSVIIALAKSLNLDVIAEGVEKEKQQKFLFDNDCKKIQGFLYARPLSREEFEAFMKRFETLMGLER